MRKCEKIGFEVEHIYVWDEYVVVYFGSGYHLFYKPSFIGYERYHPYHRIGSILLVIGVLSIIAALILNGASQASIVLSWLGFIALLLSILGFILLIIGIVLLMMTRQSLILESHGGLCFEYLSAPEITSDTLKKLVKKLETAQYLEETKQYDKNYPI